MIINITDKCTLKCPHCFLDCKPSNDTFMTKETLKAIIDSPLFKGSFGILISGGEPTTHPDFFEFMYDYILPNTNRESVVILSNGFWSYDESFTVKMKKLADDPKVNVQITNDPRFYPLLHKRIKHESIGYEDTLRVLDPLGRGKNLDIKDYPSIMRRSAPSCFNMRSVLQSGQVSSIVQAVSVLEMKGSFCSTMIKPNGDISLSECGRYIVGNINDPDALGKAMNEILYSIEPCDSCGIYGTTEPHLKIFKNKER